MIFPIQNFIIIAILGLTLLYSYYYYAVNTPNVNRLWGRIKNPFLTIYYISMFLSAISFLLLLLYLALSKNLDTSVINKLFISIICIVFFSLFWMPLSINYLKKSCNITKFLIYLDLFLVALFSFYLVYLLFYLKDNSNIIFKNLALYGMIIFFIHVFFLDFIIWTSNFF